MRPSPSPSRSPWRRLSCPCPVPRPRRRPDARGRRGDARSCPVRSRRRAARVLAKRVIAPAAPVLAAAVPTPHPREEPAATGAIAPRLAARQPIPLPTAALQPAFGRGRGRAGLPAPGRARPAGARLRRARPRPATTRLRCSRSPRRRCRRDGEIEGVEHVAHPAGILSNQSREPAAAILFLRQALALSERRSNDPPRKQ